MTFNDFLELSKNLNSETLFFLQIGKNQYPLSQIKASRDNFFALSGNKPMTNKQIRQIFAKFNNKNLPFIIHTKTKLLPIYGIQLKPDQNAAILK